MSTTPEKTVLITGANAGIGKEVARQLALRPEIARIYLACRNRDKATTAKAELEAATGRRIFDIVVMDVADLDSVRAGLAGIIGSVDALVMNAGVIGPKTMDLTVDGVTTVFATNVLGHVVLLEGLLAEDRLGEVAVLALADDLREWFLACGRPGGHQPVLPAHDEGFWAEDDWRNWRRRVWHGEPARTIKRTKATPPRPGCAPAGTRPRDLRSSFVTLRVYEGVPLTQIAREVGTSVRMIEQHYAGVIANWDGNRVPADRQIRAARKAVGRGVDALEKERGAKDEENPC